MMPCFSHVIKAKTNSSVQIAPKIKSTISHPRAYSPFKNLTKIYSFFA